MADGADLDDAELARRAATGCRDSFATLAMRYQVRIVHYVRQLAGRADRGDADDIAQEAFVRAWRAIGSYDPRWAFSTWLFTIARRVYLNHARSARRRQVRDTAVASAAATLGRPRGCPWPERRRCSWRRSFWSRCLAALACNRPSPSPRPRRRPL